MADTLRRGLDIVCGLECLDPLRKFGNAGRFAAWLRCLAGEPGFELVAKGSQFGEITVVE